MVCNLKAEYQEESVGIRCSGPADCHFVVHDAREDGIAILMSEYRSISQS